MTAGVYLGLDYGRKRIGIAVSTPLGTVHPRPRLERTTPERDLAALRELVAEIEAKAVVLGLPHHMDGSPSEMELEVRAFAKALAKACGRPVYGSDERLTSEAAETILRSRQVYGRANRERRDSAAASLVLQDFLSAGQEGEQIA